MSNDKCAFLLGANTKEGFFSLFDSACKEPQAKRIFAIKSGPGCGKSTLMKKIAQHSNSEGRTEYIYCSSDPNSLDGVIIHDSGSIYLDGTAPHVTEPDIPGAAGGYITTPEFLDSPRLEEKKQEIEQLKERIGQCYEQAYRLIAAAAKVQQHSRAELLPMLPKQRIVSRAKAIAQREIPKKQGEGMVRYRFLDAISPDGIICFSSTINTLADKIYELRDNYAMSHIFLSPILEHALANGHEVYACLSPVDPGRLLHLILPELRLAIVTEDGERAITNQPHRRIRLSGYMQAERFREVRGRVRLMGKIAHSLIEDAVEEIALAHAVHDEIELQFLPHIDYKGLDELAQRLISIEQAF